MTCHPIHAGRVHVSVLLLPLAAGYHLSLPLSVARTVRRTAAPSLCEDEMSWQEELERVLSPGTAQSDREVLLKDLLGRGPEIAQQVTEAVSSGSFASLLPEDGQSSELMDDLATVQRQITEDILPALEPARLQEAVQRAATEGPGLAQEAASTAPAAVASLLQDPARALNLVQQEARNVVSRTPEGLETPSYQLVSLGNGYETREYTSYGVAVTPIAVAWDLAAITVGFNQLVAYILGSNQRSEGMEMTTPLRVDVLPSGECEMAFPLPSKYSALTAPAPSDARVSLRQTEKQAVAVCEFTGYATEGEVQRQLSTLLDRLRRDAVDIPDPDAYAVLQYNPPFTLPWLRRNELIVQLNLGGAVETPEEEAVETEVGSAELVDGEVRPSCRLPYVVALPTVCVTRPTLRPLATA